MSPRAWRPSPSIAARDSREVADMITTTVPCVLSDELEQFRTSVRKFAEAKLAEGYLERALGDAFPPGFCRELGAAGLLGLEVATEYGGQGADHLAAAIAADEN